MTATLWGYFANNLFLARLAQTQAQMIDQPGLSYGLFHLAVRPNKLYGIVITGITFQGLNMDVGHMRYLRWSKANDKQAWIAYNRMRGQQASALEHATPEAFWIDRTQCRYTDETGQIQNPTLTDCPQAVSAVKALAIAASQGQKIYTITQKNAAVALPKLALSKGVAEEIQNAVAAGKEVTVHEKAINAYGFSGFGYIIIDPETGVGGYLVEGKGSGGWLPWLQIANNYLLWYGPMAWEKIRTDRLFLESLTGKLNEDYRNAEHFLYSFQYLTPEHVWLTNAIATEGYWVVKILTNLILQKKSPWSESPPSFNELIAGLYAGYCVTFGCEGI